MAKLTRQTQKIFANSAGSRQITAFGTAKAEDPTFTKELSQIQNTNYLYGWAQAVLQDKAPFEEDMNALFYVVTRQLAYLFQAGMPEYDSNTEYGQSDLCKGIGTNIIYQSLVPENLGNALTDGNYWSVFFSPSDFINMGTELDSLKDYVDEQISSLSQSIQTQLPDYSKGVSVAFPLSSNPFTAPQNGIYVTSIFKNQSSTQLYINNVLSAYKHTDRADGASYGDFTIPLSKGDIVWWDSAVSTVSTSMFYPYKNAQ